MLVRCFDIRPLKFFSESPFYIRIPNNLLLFSDGNILVPFLYDAGLTLSIESTNQHVRKDHKEDSTQGLPRNRLSNMGVLKIAE